MNGHIQFYYFFYYINSNKNKTKKTKNIENKKNKKKEKLNIEKNGKTLYVQRKQIVPPLSLLPLPPPRKSLMNKSPSTNVLKQLPPTPPKKSTNNSPPTESPPTSTSEGINHKAIAQEMTRNICQLCKNTANKIIGNEIRAPLENQIIEQVLKKLQEQVYAYENLVNKD